MDQQYQLVVIGAGPGGYVAAIRAAQLGLKTAVIENRDVGGTCLNRGCIPTKSMLHAAELYHEAVHNFETLGLHADHVTLDPAKIQARKEEVVGKLRGGVEQLFRSNGIAHLRGRSVKERVLQLISIAHPDFRDQLTYEAKKAGYFI